ncbi:MAG: sigma-70 family RNA polymerase sigma factor [Bacteroidetes bacterium]|nr:sigma-70 family RNA polymerase sigma factor [Bacteroidota bacterium]
MTDLTETEEIARAQRDAQAFAPLYERHFTTVFRFIHRRAGSRELTADLTQQTFLKALLALERYQARGLPFRAWLFRIALNELRMHWRKRKEVVMELSFAEVKGLGAEIGLKEADEDMARLARALSTLPPEKARLIELRYMDGLSFAEVGQVLGLGEDAAKMRTHRVLALLREQIGPRT